MGGQYGLDSPDLENWLCALPDPDALAVLDWLTKLRMHPEAVAGSRYVVDGWTIWVAQVPGVDVIVTFTIDYVARVIGVRSIASL